MNNTATAINVLVPCTVWQENYGICRHCLDFVYNPEENNIKDWPKAVEYNGRTYVRTGYNTDINRVHYKESKVAHAL